MAAGTKTMWQLRQMELMGRVEIGIMSRGSRNPTRFLMCSLVGAEIVEGAIARGPVVWGNDAAELIGQLFNLVTHEGTVVRPSRPLRQEEFTFDHEFGSWV